MNKINFLPPWVETNLQPAFYDLESGTVLQQTSRMYAKVNQLIRNVNDQNETINEYIQKFIDLHNHVDEYFDSLDVQDEINNKLDDMAEQGQLATIISIYLEMKSLLEYPNLATLKSATNIADGSYVQTLGYYSLGDGGGGYYKIRAITEDDTTNDRDLIALDDDTLVAEFIPMNSQIVVNQFGAYGDGSHNDTDAIQATIDYCSTRKLVVKFLAKNYATTLPLVLKECSKLQGIKGSDEYANATNIINTHSNMITLAGNTIGIHIDDICFYGGGYTNTALRFLAGDASHAFEWCQFNNLGIRNYYQVFDVYMLGCRMNNIMINHVTTAGILHGSDNTNTDWFIGTNYGSDSKDLLTLDGYSLSRFTNIYFTGKTDVSVGCRHIVKLGGYCNNLLFDGCYFDFSDGSAVYAVGQGNDYPTSGCSNITFDSCLFRGNCCSSDTVYHVIETEYVSNFNINNCSFNEQTRYTVNASSKLYNIKQYSEGVNLNCNHYEDEYSITNTSILNNVCMFEPGIRLYGNNSVVNDGSRTIVYNQHTKGRFKSIDIASFSGTTGATYGELTIPFGYTLHTTPKVIVQVDGGEKYACINSITTSNVQIIVRRENGNTITSTPVTGTVMIVTNDEYYD